MQVRYPIIVIDGPDGVGKTTLGQRIAERLNGKFLHLTYRFKDKMDLYHTAALYNAIRWADNQAVVIDRWWASELVYANVYRGGTRWPLLWRMLHRSALRFGVYYVWAMPEADTEVYLKRYNELRGKRTEMYDSGMDKVKREFQQIIRRVGQHDAVHYVTVFPFDLHKTSDAIIDRAIHRHRARPIPLMITELDDVTGNTLDPKVILLGDKSNPKGRRTAWPFFESAHSSQWLTEKFEQLQIKEQNLLIANVHERYNGYLNHQLLLYLKERYADVPVVAMGAQAYAGWYEATGSEPHRQLKHPQWYRRFNSDQGLLDLEELAKVYKLQEWQ